MLSLCLAYAYALLVWGAPLSLRHQRYSTQLRPSNSNLYLLVIKQQSIHTIVLCIQYTLHKTFSNNIALFPNATNHPRPTSVPFYEQPTRPGDSAGNTRTWPNCRWRLPDASPLVHRCAQLFDWFRLLVCLARVMPLQCTLFNIYIYIYIIFIRLTVSLTHCLDGCMNL